MVYLAVSLRASSWPMMTMLGPGSLMVVCFVMTWLLSCFLGTGSCWFFLKRGMWALGAQSVRL